MCRLIVRTGIIRGEGRLFLMAFLFETKTNISQNASGKDEATSNKIQVSMQHFPTEET